MSITLDHVTVGARTLEQGASYVNAALGVEMSAGGQHQDMGTHNRVLRVGESPFLELLAIDPGISPPPRPRWFGLDDPAQAKRLARRPRPIGWVVQSDQLDIDYHASPVDLGRLLSMSRGSRSWRITVPDSGMMPFSGLVPALIQWSGGPHPSASMALPGPVLERVELRHPQADQLQEVLGALGVAHLAAVEQDISGPSIALVFRLPNGERRTLK
jgi:Glyoxalase-like domain